MQAKKIEKDLKALIHGEVHCDDYHRILYSTAACIYQIMPLGVVLPRDDEDLATVVHYARENGISITGRGGGSGVSGQTVNTGLIVDFSKYMNRVLDVDKDAGTVRVQPGLVYDRLNRALKEHGRFFPPDPSSGPFCTIGGMIGNNAGGSHSVKYGSMKENIISVRAMTALGELIETERVALDLLGGASERSSAHLHYAARYAGLLRGREDLVRAWKPQVKRNASGYNVFDSFDGSQIDLAKLIVGSEGTLCLVTEATLNVTPIPAAKGTALCLFNSVEKAGEAVVEILRFAPSCLEIMDQTFVRLIREEVPAMRSALPGWCLAIIILEVDGSEKAAIESQIDDIGSMLLKRKLASEFRKALERKEQEKLWSYRKSASPILSSKEGIKRNTRFVEDASVLPERLPEFISGMRKIISKQGFEFAIFGHAGDSNIHVNPLLDQKDAADLRKLEKIAEEASELVYVLKGSLTGEHGDGRLRSPFLPKMFGPLYGIFEEIKHLFDPESLLNPGIKVGSIDYRITDNMRYGNSYSRFKTGSPFDEKDLAIEVEKCHGCGTCRQYCPVFLATGDEKATARAKANLIRACISGRIDPKAMTDEEFKEMIDLCFNCRLCHTECPTKIMIPELALIAKERYSRKKGYTLPTYLLNRSFLLSRFGSLFPALSNSALASKLLRRAGEAALGVSGTVGLAEFVEHSLDASPERFFSSGGSRKAAYFYGCFASFHDRDGEGMGTIEVLNRNGFDVHLPPQACCGIASISNGDSGSIIPDAEYNVETLSKLIDEGYVVIYSAPSCGMAIVEDYPRILGTEEAMRVAKNCFDIHEFLVMLEKEGELNTRFGPVSKKVVYHNPCHLQSRGMGLETVGLLRKIPSLELVEIEDSCCGIAGTFGMKSENREMSVAVGRPLFDSIETSGVPAVVTGCGTCNMQIRSCTSKEVIHPVTILAESYRSADPSR